ncbi:MAG TPA: hypothetical protein VFW30_13835 [Bryocella sp.]|nr:hypothetical protein [Bryocella sp.]
MTDFNRTVGRYQLNNAYDWAKPLMGQQVTDTYKGAETNLAQSYNRNQERIQNGLNHPQGGSSNDLVGNLTSMFEPSDEDMASDPELRRCLELGGTMENCRGSGVAELGKMAMAGVSKLIGVNSDSGEPLSGVLLVGAYHSRAELPEIDLTWTGTAQIKQCGTLVSDDHEYTLRKSGAMTEVVIANEPNPIVLTLRPDGSLAGPGSVQVKGRIITGYRTETRQVMVNGAPAAVQGYYCNGACSTSTTYPVYGPSMQRCTIGQLAPAPQPPPPPKETGLMGQMTKMIGGGDPVATIYGFRVTGPYVSPAGMKLAFDNNSVVMDCGKAHVKVPYTVDNTTSGFVIHVQNGGGAFLLNLAPDNTLRGAGATTVNGRLLTGVHNGEASFSPDSENCSVATFAPQGKQNTIVARGGPAPVVPASYASAAERAPVSATHEVAGGETGSPSVANSLAGVGITPTPSGARAQFRVLLSSEFSGANPLAGGVVFVAREPMDRILRELGVAVPARTTPAQAMKALQTQCHSAQGCSTVIQALPKHYVAQAKLDASGKAIVTATAATGQYYFSAIVPSAGGTLVWDLPVDLRAGDNKVAFSQANAGRVQ